MRTLVMPTSERYTLREMSVSKLDRFLQAQAKVPRRALLAMLPSGTAGSEHAVEMAVARLRSSLGTRAVQTVIKRRYRRAAATND